MPQAAAYEQRGGGEPDTLFQTLSKHSEGNRKSHFSDSVSKKSMDGLFTVPSKMVAPGHGATIFFW